ncbi:sugar kinase [Labedella populi]|uniref:Sugar kinase n=1 Tax=Labedella populi TaxID=2498850 RepID=A0A3S4C8D6_9MICO|nr:sugar kinase [Labedella populi]RWZ64417.1 sugar kinase [Labedella populi]
MKRELDVLSIGESLGLLVTTRNGRLAHARDMRLGFGGAESNVAIGVARLGGTAGWIGKVGADGVGDLIVRELRAERVETHPLVDAHAATALMLKERPTPGTSRITYYRRDHAGSHLVPDEIAPGLVERARVLHITGISAGLGGSLLTAVHAAITRAHASGVVVSFDVNHRSALWADGTGAAVAYRALAERADVIFAGVDEAEILTNETAPARQLDALRRLGPRCAVVKRGALGSLAEDDSGRADREALRVDVVDTVGAGDAFVAGWLAETVRGSSLEDRLRVATECGAFACTVDGDWEAAPTREDLRRLHLPAHEPVQR